jgi:transcriptional regulator GlxA family with amidase domain
VSSVAGVWDIFSIAKQLLTSDTTLKLSLIGRNHFSQQTNSPISLSPSELPENTDYDLIIITALGPIPKKGITFDPALISWLKSNSDKGAAIASVCTGAFLLASTGLLNQRRATTHWTMAAQFKQQFPSVELRTENMLTHDGSFFCSGGAYAFQDLCLYLIETFFGRELAETCSSLLMIELGTRSQLTFSGLQALKVHSDEQILNAQNWLEDNLDSSESVDEIASHFNMSTRNFVRRFKAAVNETPSSYIQKLRVEKAKYLLESSNLTIDAIALKAGYQDTQYFRTLFKKISGMTPSQFRESKVKK